MRFFKKGVEFLLKILYNVSMILCEVLFRMFYSMYSLNNISNWLKSVNGISATINIFCSSNIAIF